VIFIGPSLPIGTRPADRGYPFEALLDTDEGWAKDNIHYWRRDFDGYLQFFFSRCFTEPHSTKQIEDAVGWGHEIGAETLILGEYAAGLKADETLDLCARVQCPVLVVVGDEDAITGPGPGIALAESVRVARLVTVTGGGHIPDARDPVLVNLLIRDFVAAIHPGFGRRP
jgi:pimeloyl-ACP methyl ester carboxylesterase